jgi:hypothetical protein
MSTADILREWPELQEEDMGTGTGTGGKNP